MLDDAKQLDGMPEREAMALWIELYGEPPAIQSDYKTLLGVMVATLQDPPAGPPAPEPPK